MATSAFKSTTRRSSVANSPGGSSSSNRSSSSVHRRARSLSRFSRRLPGVGDDDIEATPAPRSKGRFVNTLRGSGFPEISLDDLAIELFDSSLRGRSASRIDDFTPRYGSRGSAGGRLTSDTASSRRRRSVSVVRYQISDSESDLDRSQNSSNRASMKSSIVGNNHISSAHRPTAPNNRQGLRRSLSQKDLKYYDGYSGEHPIEDDVNGGLYAAMRAELRHAVEEIKTQLEQSMVKTKKPGTPSGDSLRPDNSDANQAVSAVRRKCTTKLEKWLVFIFRLDNLRSIDKIY
ncbi:hypothetical protein V6N11_046400 [Hibiscus sabdariffa]|uniref:Uncharacterized protein n=2 Tax=Hibiscus sabdariffa TaxID=183260 RepID=A0ABR2BVN6_9ROSI